MTMDFIYHSDAGHGWLFANNAQLVELGLTRSSFTQYSYCNFDGVYAEEDCDAAIIVNAAKDQGKEYAFVVLDRTEYGQERYADGDHWIRNLQRCA